MNLTDGIGAAGVSILLLAFVLSLTNKISTHNLWYAGLNVAGAGLACVASIMLKYWPFIVLEGAWTLVSATALVKSWRKKR
jgi:hypothetical protein